MVWTPFASVVLGAEPRRCVRPGDVQALSLNRKLFYQKWLPKIARDPAYNPALSLGFPVSVWSLRCAITGIRSAIAICR